MFLYINYPKFIHPEIFPGIPFLGLLRWYGLMYIVAFSLAYIALRKVMKEGALDSEGFKCTEDDIFSFIFCGIIFLLLGARIGHCLIYTPQIYLKAPWLILWPFRNGHFTGFAGMSYHVGFIGGLIGMLVWCYVKKKPAAKWIDAMVCAIPLGYTFGRIGNFLNGELYGRITTVPWGMTFNDPNVKLFSTSEQWVQDFCAKIGMDIQNMAYVNLPRHPSQLYEALFEGLLLWAVIWALRNHKKFDGMLACIYTGGYGLVRFVIEYFRQPDEDIGYRLGDKGASIYQNTSIWNFSTGQILCFIMIIASIGFAIWLYIRDKKQKESGLLAKAEKISKKSKK